MSYPIRRVLAKTRLILDEMCRLYGKFPSYFSSYKWPYCVVKNHAKIASLLRGPDVFHAKKKSWEGATNDENGSAEREILIYHFKRDVFVM